MSKDRMLRGLLHVSCAEFAKSEDNVHTLRMVLVPATHTLQDAAFALEVQVARF